MHDRVAAGAGRHDLDPFPEGWYFVATRRRIRKRQLIERTWLGERIVAWCDGEGRICVARSVCPHLGSALGPGAGGRVRNGCLVCPFHGFEFDATGRCVNTPFAPPPGTARLKVFATQEILGLVFAWWGADRREPRWHIGEVSAEEGEWSALRTAAYRFPGHPQETTENSVDLGRLRHVHGYEDVRRAEPVTVRGAHLRSRIEFRRTGRFAVIRTATFDVAADTHIHGLGYSFGEIRERTLGISERFWMLATPIDGREIELVLASQVRNVRKPGRPITGVGLLPLRLRTAVLNEFVLSGQRREVMRDIGFWRGKQYRKRPRLCESDGGIALYRSWCRQFYPDARGGGVGGNGMTKRNGPDNPTMSDR